MFRTKTLNFTRFIQINWLAKMELRGPGPPDCQIVVNYSYTRVLLFAKMQRETELKKHLAFLSHFHHWWRFNWGWGGPFGPPG